MIVIDANKRKELSDIGYNCDFSDSIDSKYPNILEMTKVELHTHLLGSFNLEDLWELCKKYNKDTIYPEFIAHFGNYHNFDDFSKTRKYKNKLIHSYEDFSFLMDGYIQYLKKQHIVYVEPAIAMFELPPLKPERLIEIAHNKLKEGGIQFSFIMDLIRGDGPKELKKRYDFYHELSPEYNIRGVGLAGNERKYGLNPNLIPIFDEAKTDGYGISIHL
ncbi:MAG: hypothetical protein LBG52_01290 [Candidatus Peribacteria bacterium]|jgi:adenosine deaminase|nr:hypothetical protein [Candidatus Peribacteria bacterium]